MWDIQVQQKPSLEPYKQTILDFLNKHLNYKILKPDLIKIYTDAYTARELKEINVFYGTPTGKKSLRITPLLTAKGSQLRAQKVQQNMHELTEMIEKKAEEIELHQNN